MDIRSGEDLGDRMRAGLGPLSTGARLWLEPMKARIQGWLGPSSASASEAGGGAASTGSGAAGAGGGAEGGLIAEMREGGATAEFSRRLQQRYNTKKAGESGGGGGTGEL